MFQLQQTVEAFSKESKQAGLKYHLQCRCRITLSKTRNASRISSSLSVSFIFLAIIVKNSGKSMVPLPQMRTKSSCKTGAPAMLRCSNNFRTTLWNGKRLLGQAGTWCYSVEPFMSLNGCDSSQGDFAWFSSTISALDNILTAHTEPWPLKGAARFRGGKAQSTEGCLFPLPREAFQIVSPALPCRPHSKSGQSGGANPALASGAGQGLDLGPQGWKGSWRGQTDFIMPRTIKR